uniref:Secreted protein n=1 Tax=Ixodes ricinus TaxID=34613 RepID=A0A6B0UCF3_IXORI
MLLPLAFLFRLRVVAHLATPIHVFEGSGAGAVVSTLLEQDGLALCLVLDVLRETLEEFGVLSLVDGTQDRCWRPAAWVDGGAVGDLAGEIIPGNLAVGLGGVHERLAH